VVSWSLVCAPCWSSFGCLFCAVHCVGCSQRSPACGELAARVGAWRAWGAPSATVCPLRMVERRWHPLAHTRDNTGWRW
jgi:hypothetical protein